MRELDELINIIYEYYMENKARNKLLQREWYLRNRDRVLKSNLEKRLAKFNANEKSKKESVQIIKKQTVITFN